MLVMLAVSYLGMVQHLEGKAEQGEVSDRAEQTSVALAEGDREGQKGRLENCWLLLSEL